MTSRRVRSLLTFALLAGGAGIWGPSSVAHGGGRPVGLEFLGQQIIPTGTQFAGTEVGGLSSITYDAARGVF
jgi:hypothetical protein